MDEQEKKMLRDVHDAIVGNDELGHEGLVRGFRRHDKWIRTADLRIAAIIGGVTVVVFLVKVIYFK